MKEYYSILGVSESATAEEIKKAYRKKAMELHPDRHGGDKSKEAEFKKLNEAYSVLSDSEKRANYDRFGTAEGMGGFGGFGGGFDAGDIGDIFSSFFGGGFSRGGRKKQDIGEDIEIHIKISLSDAIKGTNRKVEYTRQNTCHHCAGKGGTTRTCHTCQGSGTIRERIQTLFGTMEQARPCHTCHGTGEEITLKCTYCHGKGKIAEKKERTIDVPAGIENGMSMKIRGEGQSGRDANGDLYIVFDVPQREAGLERDGADLHYTVKLSPAEATLGVEKLLEIPILGKKELRIEGGTQTGEILTYRGEGIERLDRKGSKGNLLIHLEIETPKKLTADQKKLYEALLASEGQKKMKKGWLSELFGE